MKEKAKCDNALKLIIAVVLLCKICRTENHIMKGCRRTMKE